MSSLKETKIRIDSVKKTLKITSVMKLIAAAKLKKTQNKIANLLPYQKELEDILLALLSDLSPKQIKEIKDINLDFLRKEDKIQKLTIVVISSNSSLCGAFNHNIIKAVFERIEYYKSQGISHKNINIIPIGKKVSQEIKKAGFDIDKDYHYLTEKPNYEDISKIVEALMSDFSKSNCDKVEIVYNHLKNAMSQPTQIENFLPLSLDNQVDNLNKQEDSLSNEYILEPSFEELLSDLLPQTLKLKLYSILLDAISAEHSARTMAMQLASDNAEKLVKDLSLEYNKGRQQKITNEILDLVSGME